MLMQRIAIAIAVASTGCSEHAPSWYAVTDGNLSEATADTSTSFAPVTSTDGGVATTGSSPTSSADSSTGGVTADSSIGNAGSWSTGAPADAAPQVFVFTVETNNDTPGQIFEAGEVSSISR